MALRKLRNGCRFYMTRDQSKIGYLRQLWWWWHKPYYTNAFLVIRQAYDREVPVAFGVQNGHEVTGGVALSWRGEGLGRLVFSLLTKLAWKPARLEVLESNIVARRLYESLGWRYNSMILGRFESVLTMRFDPVAWRLESNNADVAQR